MKTLNLIKIAAVVLLGVALSGNVQANPDKYTRKSIPTVKEMLARVNMNFDSLHHYGWFAQPFEEWMFEPDYLSQEPASTIEPWMFEEKYLNEEAQPLESWMFDETRLSASEEKVTIEPWMIDPNYLSK